VWQGAANGAANLMGSDILEEPQDFELAASVELGKVDVLVHPCYRKRKLMTATEAREVRARPTPLIPQGSKGRAREPQRR
jgi:hypothetical protein